MDPVSQGALGAAAAVAVFGRSERLPLGFVALIGAGSAMAPDLDVLIRSSTDSLLAIKYHRHFTHSLAFVPVGAALSILPWLANQKVRAELAFSYLVSLLGYFTHAPLDCTTTYGTLYFWPFSDYRVSLSWVSVVDPLYTLPLLGLLGWGLVQKRLGLVRIGLFWSLFYLGWGAFQNARASSAQREVAQTRGHQPLRRDVFTTFMQQITWRSAYEAEGRLFIDEIRVPYFGAPCVIQGGTMIPLGPPPAGAGPGERRGYRLLSWFSSGWVARDPSQPELLGDVRYSLLPHGTRPFWGVIIDRKADKANWVNTRIERDIRLSDVLDLFASAPDGTRCQSARDAASLRTPQ